MTNTHTHSLGTLWFLFSLLAEAVAINSVLWGFQSVRLWLFHLRLSYSV